MNEPVFYEPKENLKAIDMILMNINNPTYRLVRNNADNKIYFCNDKKVWIKISQKDIPVYLNPIMKRMKLFIRDTKDSRESYVEFQNDGKKLKNLVYSLIADNIPFYDVPKTEESKQK